MLENTEKCSLNFKWEEKQVTKRSAIPISMSYLQEPIETINIKVICFYLDTFEFLGFFFFFLPQPILLLS